MPSNCRTLGRSLAEPSAEQYLIEERKKKEDRKNELLEQIKERALASSVAKEREMGQDKEMNEAIQREQDRHLQEQLRKKQALVNDARLQRDQAVQRSQLQKVNSPYL